MAAQFSSSLDSHLSGTPLTASGRTAVAQAKRATLGRPSVAGVPPGEAVVAAEHCAGGQLAGAPLDAAGVHAPAGVPRAADGRLSCFARVAAALVN